MRFFKNIVLVSLSVLLIGGAFALPRWTSFWKTQNPIALPPTQIISGGTVSGDYVSGGTVIADLGTNASGWVIIDNLYNSSGVEYTALATPGLRTGDGTTLYPVQTGETRLKIGEGAISSSSYSMAIGNYTHSNSDFSTALGYDTKANGIGSLAIGYATKSNGNFSTAMGIDTTAGGSFSTAMGTLSVAGGDYSIAGGNTASAVGVSSVALGNNTLAEGDKSFAMGSFSKAYGVSSSAIGNSVITYTTGGMAIGNYNEGITGALFEIGNGEWGAESNILEVYSTGIQNNGIYNMGDGTGSYNIEVANTPLFYGPVITPNAYVPGIGAYPAIITKGMNFFLDENGADIYLSNVDGTFATVFNSRGDEAKFSLAVMSGNLTSTHNAWTFDLDGTIKSELIDPTPYITDDKDFTTKKYVDTALTDYVPRTAVDTGWNNTGSDTIIPSEKLVWSLVSGLNNNYVPYRSGGRLWDSNIFISGHKTFHGGYVSPWGNRGLFNFNGYNSEPFGSTVNINSTGQGLNVKGGHLGAKIDGKGQALIVTQGGYSGAIFNPAMTISRLHLSGDNYLGPILNIEETNNTSSQYLVVKPLSGKQFGIYSGGNVGIGIINPQHSLSISGDVMVNTGGRLYLSSVWRIGLSGNNFVIQALTGGVWVEKESFAND